MLISEEMVGPDLDFFLSVEKAKLSSKAHKKSITNVGFLATPGHLG